MQSAPSSNVFSRLSFPPSVLPPSVAHSPARTVRSLRAALQSRELLRNILSRSMYCTVDYSSPSWKNKAFVERLPRLFLTNEAPPRMPVIFEADIKMPQVKQKRNLKRKRSLNSEIRSLRHSMREIYLKKHQMQQQQQAMESTSAESRLFKDVQTPESQALFCDEQFDEALIQQALHDRNRIDDCPVHISPQS